MGNFNVPLSDLKLPNKIWACKENASLHTAIKVMQKHQIGCLIISNENRDILGIFTERDVLLKIVDQGLDLTKEKVGDYMTPHPTCMKLDEDIISVVKAMQLGQFRHMVVLNDDSSLKAVISIKDIVRKMLNIIENKHL
jgi:predicted transcriptional regulator